MRTSSSALIGRSTASRCASMRAPIPTSRSSTQASSNRRRYAIGSQSLPVRSPTVPMDAPLGTYARRTLGWSSAATSAMPTNPGYQVAGFHRDVLLARRPGRRGGSPLSGPVAHKVDPGHLVSRIPGTVEGLLLTGTDHLRPSRWDRDDGTSMGTGARAPEAASPRGLATAVSQTGSRAPRRCWSELGSVSPSAAGVAPVREGLQRCVPSVRRPVPE